MDPEIANECYNRKNANINNGEYEKAIVDYSRVINLDPQNSDAYNNHGVVYNKIGKKKLAKRDFKKAEKMEY